MRLLGLTTGVLALALLIVSCSAVTLSVQNGDVNNPGESTTITIMLDSAPDGLSGYLINVSVTNPAVAELESVSFPGWTIFHVNSTLPSGTSWIAAAGENLPGSTNITFATFTVKGLQAGSTTIDLGITEIDDINGDSFVPNVQPGTFTVGMNYTVTATAGAGGSISPSGMVSVPQGTNKTFNVTPNGGYTIADVLVDAVSQGAVPSYTFTNVTANHTITASFSAIPVNYTVTATAGAGGSISPSGMVIVPEGTNQTFDITPDSGYVIDDVLVDAVSQGVVPSYTFTNVTANHTITASFSAIIPGNFTINATAGMGGSISPSGMVIVPEGTNQTFDITPDSGYVIADVLVDAVSQGAVPSYTFTNVTADHTITASFSSVAVNFTINATAGMGGSISPSGMVIVPEGTNQTFDIAPDSGYVIDDVLVDAVSQGAVPSYTFTNVTEDHVISASFSPITFTITATAGAGGTISPSGMIIVPAGMNQTFTVAANSGFAIDDVLVDAVSQGAVPSYTFTNVTANHTISAEFTLNPANKATLYVASYPTGATILLDGLDVGKTDQFIYHAPAGVHNLTLEKGGYASKTLMVTIPVEGLKVLEPITLIANGGPTGTGTLYVASYPTNAVILIDGVESGHTNTFVYGVQSGTRNLTLTKTGYQPKTTLVPVPAGGLKVLAPITLSPV
jgi:hypothetical protein